MTGEPATTPPSCTDAGRPQGKETHQGDHPGAGATRYVHPTEIGEAGFHRLPSSVWFRRPAE